MKKSFETLAIALLLACAFACCKQKASQETEPEAEVWFGLTDSLGSVYECSVDGDSESFKVTEEQDSDGSRCVSIEHLTFAATMHYRLFDSSGALRIVAAGPQEQVGMNGFRIDYDAAGRVSNIVDIGSLDGRIDEQEGGGSVAAMKSWLAESLEASPQKPDSLCVRRDEEGNIIEMEGIDIPRCYRARLMIKEWGPFWDSDLRGGNLQFFVLLEKYKNVEGSHVNYLYVNGQLLAELAYRNGMLMKVRTYNRYGSLVADYDDRSINIWEQIYYDYMF